MGGTGYGGSQMSKEMYQTHTVSLATHLPPSSKSNSEPPCTVTDTLGSQPGHTHSPTHLSALPLTGQARWDLLVTRDRWAP